MAPLLQTIKDALASTIDPDNMQVSAEQLGATGESFKQPVMHTEQLKLVDEGLDRMKAGNPDCVFSVAADALKAIPGNEPMSLLEVGCATGYYVEVIRTLVGDRFSYVGGDYSDTALEIARQRYPDVEFRNLDIRALDVADRQYDVVLTGAVIVHVDDWRSALDELARVTGKYLVLHRTPMTVKRTCRREEAIYGGVPVFINAFNRHSLMSIMNKLGFKKIFSKNVYEKKSPSFEYVTYVFERTH